MRPMAILEAGLQAMQVDPWLKEVMTRERFSTSPSLLSNIYHEQSLPTLSTSCTLPVLPPSQLLSVLICKDSVFDFT
jgi:hypothetical protein